MLASNSANTIAKQLIRMPYMEARFLTVLQSANGVIVATKKNRGEEEEDEIYGR